MKALLSHDQTAIWPRLCLRDDFWPTKKVGICCPNATVSGNIIIKSPSLQQLARLTKFMKEQMLKYL